MILLRDLVKENIQNIFGEEMGGSGGPRPPYEIPAIRMQIPEGTVMIFLGSFADHSVFAPAGPVCFRLSGLTLLGEYSTGDQML